MYTLLIISPTFESVGHNLSARQYLWQQLKGSSRPTKITNRK